MDETQEIVSVKIVSRESVKPSSPTPPHLKVFKLSFLNQILPLVPIFPTCGLVFYSASTQTQTQTPDLIPRLKATLSQTLTKFYPLAGKINNSTVNCTDDGLPFLEAQADCTLSHLLNSTRKLDSMVKFLPPVESLGMGDPHVSELTHLAIQVTKFSCGGVSIGWYDIHKLLDGISAVTFLKHWAALTAAQCRPEDDNDIVEPNLDLDACVAAFPPTTKPLQLPVVNVYKEEVERSPTVAKSFVFKTRVFEELKAKAASVKVPNPTSFQAIAGFIWEQALSVSSNSSSSVLHVTLDIRPRVEPPLPSGSIGNLAVITIAKAEKHEKEKEQGFLLRELVAGINSAVLEMKEEMRGYQGEEGVEGVMENWSKVINTLVEHKDRAYRLISWSRLGFSDLDFGFGTPVRMIPTDGRMSPFHRNMIILNDYRSDDGDGDGDGIEAWLFLEHKEMANLESKPEFLAFASPAP